MGYETDTVNASRVVECVEGYTEILINLSSVGKDEFVSVLFDIGEQLVNYEDEAGEENDELVTTLQHIGRSYERFQAAQQ